MICHDGETLLYLKLPQRFSCETWQNIVSIKPALRYIYVDLGFYSTTTLLSPLNMAEYRPQKKQALYSIATMACLLYISLYSQVGPLVLGIQLDLEVLADPEIINIINIH